MQNIVTSSRSEKISVDLKDSHHGHLYVLVL